MAEKDYETLLKQLHDGQIDELVVRPPEFMDFQKIFQASPYRSQIEGNAKHGGEIHYHLIKEEAK
ncbi:hypothetical protein [Limosilactobacillus secaliphilus]|uniref:Uncharacterized protein n=1 Tax=Limosilactobacillus secaliphilus TaxID=396268 RepID=A0A0R2HZ50_9LACO|nr:hypothetical protein [Limosilactobacillus secaliphilus]KRN58112.1 hypothetical protein IV45_GL000554 [Limosilactobacillus secaliphilus]